MAARHRCRQGRPHAGCRRSRRPPADAGVLEQEADGDIARDADEEDERDGATDPVPAREREVVGHELDHLCRQRQADAGVDTQRGQRHDERGRLEKARDRRVEDAAATATAIPASIASSSGYPARTTMDMTTAHSPTMANGDVEVAGDYEDGRAGGDQAEHRREFQHADEIAGVEEPLVREARDESENKTARVGDQRVGGHEVRGAGPRGPLSYGLELSGTVCLRSALPPEELVYQALFARIRRGHGVDDLAMAHHAILSPIHRSSGKSDDTMTTARPCLRSLDEPVDVVLRADIDALRGFVEEVDLGIDSEPSADHHLLLVAAAESPDLLVHRWRHDTESLHDALSRGRSPLMMRPRSSFQATARFSRTGRSGSRPESP